MIVSAGFAAFILLCATVVFGQQANDFQDAKIISLPKPDLPKEAKATGFGGKVSVVVSIDESGKVTSATDVTGPDWVCPSVDRPDVVALRNAARNASLKAKFSPAAQECKPVKSMLRLNYEFPKKPIGGLSTSYVEGARVVGTLDNDGSSRPNATANNNGPTKTISGAVLNGTAMKLPRPTYPPAAIAVRAAGSVNIQMLIETDGHVFSAEPLSGHPLLQNAAIALTPGAFTICRRHRFR